MKPIIFARIADMKYYRGITEKDVPANGGSYVKETNEAHECYNFLEATMDDEKEYCLGFTQLIGRSRNGNIQLHIEKIVGCAGYKKEDVVDDVTVVFCSKAYNSKTMRVVGFYKHATIYRNCQFAEFDEDYIQEFNFIAEKENCVLLPYNERHRGKKWYVPTSGGNGYSFGYGRSNIWYAGSNTTNENEIDYVERMISSIENYSGENWMNEGAL